MEAARAGEGVFSARAATTASCCAPRSGWRSWRPRWDSPSRLARLDALQARSISRRSGAAARRQCPRGAQLALGKPELARTALDGAGFTCRTRTARAVPERAARGDSSCSPIARARGNVASGGSLATRRCSRPRCCSSPTAALADGRSRPRRRQVRSPSRARRRPLDDVREALGTRKRPRQLPWHAGRTRRPRGERALMAATCGSARTRVAAAGSARARAARPGHAHRAHGPRRGPDHLGQGKAGIGRSHPCRSSRPRADLYY